MNKSKKLVVTFMSVVCVALGTTVAGYASDLSAWKPEHLPSLVELDSYGSYGEVWIPDDLTVSGITEFNDSGTEKPETIGVEIWGEVFQQGEYNDYGDYVEAYRNNCAGLSIDFTEGEADWVAGHHWCRTNVTSYSGSTFSWN